MGKKDDNMVKKITLIAMVILVLTSCKARKKTIEVPTQKEIDKKDLSYTFISSEIVGDSLVAKLQYGGGCIKPHQFSLVQTPRVKADEVNIYLLHTTYDDRCKALVRTEQKFSIASLLKDNSIKSIKLNGEKELLPRPDDENLE
ncbi:MAG: hypothetical protein RLZZ337_430 [Bacteroidota bacterium]|jgi:hypothetical protein